MIPEAPGSPEPRVDLVMSFSPRRVLDAGCGTGRVACVVAARGVHVTGVDRDPAPLAMARRHLPAGDWRLDELATMQLGCRFDLVVVGGEPLRCSPTSRRAIVHALAVHLEPGGRLVSGFSVQPGGCTPGDLDAQASANGLDLVDRWSSWQRTPHRDGAVYQVSVHRRTESPTSHDLLAVARAGCPRLTAEELDGTDVLVVDVRDSAHRRRRGWIPGSVHVPATTALWRLDPRSGYARRDLARRRPVVIVCDDGYASSLIAQQLRAVGVDATDLIGGMAAWERAGLPTERPRR